MKKTKKGFTLTELIIVIGIIAILAAVLVPTLTGYIRRAKENNARIEANEINKLYQHWILEEGNSHSNIYATCDSFVNYVGSVAPNYENRINYTIINERTTVQTVSYSLMSNEVTEGIVVFLFAASNGLYTTSSVPFFDNALATAIESTAVHNNLQEATNNVFGGKDALQSSLDKWEYAVSGGTFKASSIRYTINLYGNNNEEITTLTVRAGKEFTKDFLDSKCSLVDYYVYDTEVEGSYVENGYYIKPSIAGWEYSDANGQLTAWDFNQKVNSDLDLYSVSYSDDSYEAIAFIQRNTGTVYNEYEMHFPLEMTQEFGTKRYYFNDLAVAFDFGDKYVTQDVYYYYEVEEISDGGCPATYTYEKHAVHSSVRYENAKTYYDIVKVVAGKDIYVSQNLVLPKNIKLQIPYGNIYQPAIYKKNWYDYIGRDPYEQLETPDAKLIINEGFTFDVYGEIEVGAYTTTHKNFVLNEVYVDGTNGGFGVLENNGTINIQDGGKFTSYGYTTGSGIINGLNGSLIMDMLVIYNWPGGSAALSLYLNSAGFLFNVYSISNIRCDTTINYGCEYGMHASVYLPSEEITETEKILLVGNSDSALFSFNGNENATVKKQYNNGITEIIINGDMVDNYFGINGMTLKDVYFPLYKFNITIESGNFNIRANKFMVMPGSSLVVKKEGTITFSETGGLTVLESMTISNSNERAKLPTEPGIIEVYGTVTGTGVLTGNINVKENGTVDTSNLTKYDKVVYGMGLITKVSGGYPLKTDECLLTIISGSEKQYTIRYINDANITDVLAEAGSELLAPTQDGYVFKGWYTTSTFVDATLVTTADSSMIVYAKWELDAYTITYIDEYNVDNPNPESYNINSDEIVLTALAKEGYKFLGWYNGTVLVTSIPTGSTGDITLTAKWEQEADVTTN